MWNESREKENGVETGEGQRRKRRKWIWVSLTCNYTDETPLLLFPLTVTSYQASV